jgi:signal transduction histidine kinase
MNPRATLRFRRATAAAALAWALLALVVGLRGRVESASHPVPPFHFTGAAGRYVVHAVTPAAEAAGLRPRDRLLAVDGTPVDAWFGGGGLRSLREGEPNTYSVEQPDGRRLDVRLPPSPPDGAAFSKLDRLVEFGIPLVGLIYVAIGAVVWRLKPDRPESWALLLFSCVTAALLFLSGPAYPLSRALILVNVPVLGSTAFHLFTTYPIEPAWVVRRPELRVVPYAVAAALAGLVLAGPALELPGDVLNGVATLWAVVVCLGCLGIVAVERARNRDTAVGDRADVMLLGSFASFMPVITLLAVHYFVGTSFPWTVGLLGFFVFPAAVGYGIVRKDLFDLRVLARSSAAYGAATLAITGLFAFLVTFADAVVSRFNVDARSPAFSVVFLFLAILAFNPLRSRVQRFVDRTFDRDRAAYRSAVREISEAMVSMLSVKEIVERILVAVTDTMGVERVMVLLLDEKNDELRCEASRGDWDEDAANAGLASDHPICRALWMRRTALAREDFDDEPDPELREDCRDVFDTLGAELLVPILFGVDLLGVIAVGRKLTGERLGAEERELLRTLSNQSAIAIENAKAFDEIAQLNETLEARVEERTRELRDTQALLVQSEKMRSLGQLVAGVAHELNNPIGFVHANLQLLDDYVGRLLRRDLDDEKRRKTREAIHKLLQRSREGTERVKQIVQDLRTFSRTDHAELQEVCLNEEIDRTLSLMEPRLKGGVRIERDYGELPRVRCFAGQLNQVFMNLLMNACDALEGTGTITIRTRAIRDGVRLEFEDDGPGMPPEVKARVFEPFFTTKPVGKGTGLGLSLSHGIVERHGGSMRVDSEPGGGTRFTIELPLAPPAPGREPSGEAA